MLFQVLFLLFSATSALAESYPKNFFKSYFSFYSHLEHLRVNGTENKDICVDAKPYFPKCCPKGYVYEANAHKCVKSDNNIFDTMCVKYGLEDCHVVIVDYVIKNVSSVAVHENGSLFYQNGTYTHGKYCLDFVADSHDIVLRTCAVDLDVCRKYAGDVGKVQCLKKCCPDGHIYKEQRITTTNCAEDDVFTQRCSFDPEYGLEIRNKSDRISNTEENFAIIVSQKCSKYIPDRTDEFFVATNGSVFVTESGKLHEYTLQENKYCIEYSHEHGYEFYLCHISTERRTSIQLKHIRITLIISCVCLLFTVIGYNLIPELDSLNGKIVISYCSSLFVAFVTLCWLQFNPDAGTFCVFAGFLITFAFLAAFTWMNVMSYDIWCVLCSMKTSTSTTGQTKKYLLYSLYGWLVPTLITVFAYIDHTNCLLPKYLHPHVGNGKCLIHNRRDLQNYGYYFYFIGPSGLLIFSNLVIFFKTISYIINVKNNMKKIKATGTSEKQSRRKALKINTERLIIIAKIFLVMGVNWIFEIVSSIFDFSGGSKVVLVIQLFIDMFNGLQGVFIFCIFLLKMRVYQAVVKKIRIGECTRTTTTSLRDLNRNAE